MAISKDYKRYMFACNDGNIIIETENKLKAIEKFSVRIDIEGNIIKY